MKTQVESKANLLKLLGGMATRLKVPIKNPAKGISQKELETILAKATPQMRAQIESQMGAAKARAGSRESGVRKSRKKETWAQRMADRIGQRLSKTRLRQALNPAKKNFLGLDRESRIKRKKKRARVLSAKAGVLEAKEALKRARQNPKGRGQKQPARMNLGAPKGETVVLVAANGKRIRQATKVVFPNGDVVRFTEKLPKRKAITQATALLTKNPMHPLEVASHLVGITIGATALAKGRRSKKTGPGRRPIGSRYYLFVGSDRRGNHVDTKPEAVAAARSLANATGGAVTVRKLAGTKLAVVKTVRPQVKKKNGTRESGVGSQKKTRNSKRGTRNVAKAKRNSPGEIFEDFHGQQSTKVTTGYVAADAPKEVDQLGPVVQWTIEDPKGQPVTIGSDRDGTARTIKGRVVKFDKDAVQLCAIENGSGKRRFVVTVRAVDREKFINKYPWANGKNFTYGPVAEVIYRARKPHLYNGDNRTHTFYHILGEDGGRRPTAMIKNGCPSLKYGAYEIAREGIRN